MSGGRRCTVCAHAQREEIERALLEGGSYRDISGRFGLTRSSVQRHALSHLPTDLARATAIEAEVVEFDRGSALLGRLRALVGETAEILAQAKRAGDLDLALRAIGRAEKQVELEARLLGELVDATTVNVLISPEWAAVRGVILRALSPYPEARQAVSEALTPHARS